MKAKTEATAKTAAGAAKEAQKQARATVRDARRKARRQVVRARVAAARAQAGTRAKASGASRKAVGAAGAAGLAAGYFLDPESGRRRRDQVRGRALSLIRRGKIETGKAKSKATPAKPAANDQALADRVKSEIFQPADAPKGSVNINVERGVVYLRGEVKRPDEMQKLVEQASSIEGVTAVENLLHTS
jgi:osmotically-inducible protein OsmY